MKRKILLGKPYLYAFFIGLLLQLQACQKDKPPQKEDTPVITGNKRVFINNEGNFNWGNASITLYDPVHQLVNEDIYAANNNGNALGDVCQTLIKQNNYIIAVVNNSHKLVALNSTTFQKEHEISGLNSPRYFLPVSNNKAFVSDLYNNTIYVVDLNTWKISTTIPCSGWTEEMVLSYGKAYVCNLKSNYVYVINSSSNSINDSIQVGYGSCSILKDKNEKIWVLCNGNSSSGIPARLVRFDPVSKQTELNLTFNLQEHPTQLKINGLGNTIYYLNNGVCKMDITDQALPGTPLLQKGNKLYYSLGIDPLDESIYVADAIDYVQKGKIEVYSKSGNFITSFNAGITPGGFYFDF